MAYEYAMRVAITREISTSIDRCELTHLSRQAIDIPKARAQHEAYEHRLNQAGCSVVRLPTADDLPDSVFIEDIAVVFDELAVVARPGAPSRRGETECVAEALQAYGPLRRIEAPGTLDGGDVLTVGKRVFVGRSQRTNEAAISQLAQILQPYGYQVCGLTVDGCLHLKSAVTALSDSQLLINRGWAPADQFQSSFQLIEVDKSEPYAANALRIGNAVIYPTGYPRTRARLEEAGVHILDVDVTELIKAEGAVTCCSLILDAVPKREAA
jgi:dimethylargininase